MVQEKLTINDCDPDVSADAVSTFVTLRENGIPSASIIANDDEGKTFLKTINLGDIVEVSYCYEEDGNWIVVFRGKVFELAPMFTKEGELCQVVAYNDAAYALKLMRVAEEYGTQGRVKLFNEIDSAPLEYVSDFSFVQNQWTKSGNAIDIDLPVNAFVNNHLSFTQNGTSPYLNDPTATSYLSCDLENQQGTGHFYPVNFYDQYYTFTQLSVGSHTQIKQVIFSILAYISNSPVVLGCSVWIKSLNKWVTATTYTVTSNTYSPITVDLSGILNTIDDINNARLTVQVVEVKGNIGKLYLAYAVLNVIGLEGGDYPWLNDMTLQPSKGISCSSWNNGTVDEYYTFDKIGGLGQRTIVESLTISLLAAIGTWAIPWSWGGGGVSEISGAAASIRCELWLDTSGTGHYNWVDCGFQDVTSPTFGVLTYPVVSTYLTVDAINNTRLRITLLYHKGLIATVYIGSAHIQAKLATGDACTFKNVLCNVNSISGSPYGIIPKYVNKIYGGNASNHRPLDLTYIYDYFGPYSPYLLGYMGEFKYLYFPHQSAYDCLMDMVKLESAMRSIDINGQLIKNMAGLHWIVTPDNELIIAPVGDHSILGSNIDKWNDHIVTPIVIKQDVIAQHLKLESHNANYVVVGGKFTLPINDAWCEAQGYGKWRIGQPEMFGIDGNPVDEITYAPFNDFAYFGDMCMWLRFWSQGVYAGNEGRRSVWLYLNEPTASNMVDGNTGNTSSTNLRGLDFSKICSLHGKATINLAVRKHVGPTSIKLRLYSGFFPATYLGGDQIEIPPSDWITGPNSGWGWAGPSGPAWSRGGYFIECDITDQVASDDKWYYVSVDLTYEDILYGVGHRGIWTPNTYAGLYGSYPYTYTYQADLTNIIAIAVEVSHGAGSAYDCSLYIDDVSIAGNALRAAYDSTLINQVGCRMVTIKHDLAQTDNLNPNDDSSPLAQVALYELLRHRIDLISGTIQLPLTPYLKAGQIVRLQLEQLSDESYTIDEDFRFTQVEHMFSKRGAYTAVTITNDLWNSEPLKIIDPYAIAMRAINPDFQTRTIASIRTGTEWAFDVFLAVIGKDYPS